MLTSGSSNPLLLTLGAITPGEGGTLDFTLPSGTQSPANGITTTSPNVAGILGGYATVSGTNWAASSGAAGNITAYAAYTGGNLGALSSNSSLNLLPAGAQAPVTAARSFNSLNLTGTQGVTMSGGGSLTLASGGLIGNTSGAVSGGTLAGSAGGDLYVITPQDLTIGSVIADNGGATGLVKTGSGMLTLTGNNTYSGPTTIGAGSLQVGNAGASGDLGPGMVTDNGALVFDLSSVMTFSEAISGIGSLTQAGDGTLILCASNDYDGGTMVNSGTLSVTNPNALPNGMSLTVGAGGASLFASASGGPMVQNATFDGGLVAAEGPVAVPEPGTLLLLAAGVLVAGFGVWRKAHLKPFTV